MKNYIFIHGTLSAIRAEGYPTKPVSYIARPSSSVNLFKKYIKTVVHNVVANRDVLSMDLVTVLAR